MFVYILLGIFYLPIAIIVSLTKNICKGKRRIVSRCKQVHPAKNACCARVVFIPQIA